MSEYTAIVKQDGDWWIGWIEEVPGVNCKEASRDALLETLRITLEEALEANRGPSSSRDPRRACAQHLSRPRHRSTRTHLSDGPLDGGTGASCASTELVDTQALMCREPASRGNRCGEEHAATDFRICLDPEREVRFPRVIARH